MKHYAAHGAWDTFYDVPDRIEAGPERGDEAAVSLRQKARGLVNDCLIETDWQTP